MIVNCREKVRRANDVAEAIRESGGSASVAHADLCDEPAVEAMLEEVKRRFGRLDILVLNASGGMERGGDPGYAMRLNSDAQVRLARLALPLMPPGGRIVFVTSHQAHFHPRKPVPADYLPVAASKRAGENALRQMRATLEAKGIALVVLSGDMIDGTITGGSSSGAIQTWSQPAAQPHHCPPFRSSPAQSFAPPKSPIGTGRRSTSVDWTICNNDSPEVIC